MLYRQKIPVSCENYTERSVVQCVCGKTYRFECVFNDAVNNCDYVASWQNIEFLMLNLAVDVLRR